MPADVRMTGQDRDLLFTDGWADSASDAELSAQQVEAALTIGQGEWLTDATAGVPWLIYLTSKNWSPSQVQEDVKRVLEDVPQVAVLSVVATHSGRTISIVLSLKHKSQQINGTLVVDPSRDKLGNNGYLLSFTSHVRTGRIFSR